MKETWHWRKRELPLPFDEWKNHILTEFVARIANGQTAGGKYSALDSINFPVKPPLATLMYWIKTSKVWQERFVAALKLGAAKVKKPNKPSIVFKIAFYERVIELVAEGYSIRGAKMNAVLKAAEEFGVDKPYCTAHVLNDIRDDFGGLHEKYVNAVKKRKELFSKRRREKAKEHTRRLMLQKRFCPT